jgi:hypothetical protein
LFNLVLSAFIAMLFSLSANAQTTAKPTVRDSVKLTAKFRFRDGVYATARDWRNNEPTFQDDLLLKDAIYTSGSLDFVKTPDPKVATAFAIVKDGVIYIHHNDTDSLRSTKANFVKLQIQGKLCYFSLTRREDKKVPMNVYDPSNGAYVYTGYVINRETNVYRYFFSFKTGEIFILNTENLSRQAADDKKVVATIADFKADDDLQQRLFKTLLVYNDRNTVFVKK